MSRTNRKITIPVSIGYGLTDIMGGGAFTVIGAWLLFFYTTFVGLSPVEAASIVAIARIVDAVVSLFMGSFTDHFYKNPLGKRFGRRRFFLLIGAPLMLRCAHRNQSVGENYTTDMAITNTLIHELDVLRWLLNDDYRSVQVRFPRSTSHTHARLKDPQIVSFETKKGTLIDVEVFVNCQYGYDIQCEVVGETGIARLPEPSAVQMRKSASLSTAILTDWKDRFIKAYDVELQAFINDVKAGQLHGPSAWDGYAASVAADACIKAQGTSEPVEVTLPECPAFYKR